MEEEKHSSTDPLIKDVPHYGTDAESHKQGQESHMSITLHEALDKVGSYRFFQWTVLLSVVLSFGFADILIDNLPFLVLVPQEFVCQMKGSKGWVSCSVKDICSGYHT